MTWLDEPWSLGGQPTGAMRAYFKHHSMGLEVLPLGIDEEQKSLKTIEDVMVFFAEVVSRGRN